MAHRGILPGNEYSFHSPVANYSVRTCVTDTEIINNSEIFFNLTVTKKNLVFKVFNV